MDKFEVLKAYFGHTCFRDGQEQIIDALISGSDALGIMPTGGGKSICYQIPALIFPGVTLVISPLISLMKDQVETLIRAGIPAAYINSSLSLDQIRTIYNQSRRGAYKLLYVAPERLEADSFCSLSQEIDISLVAVDEAHCISQWGQDFRPSYLRIPDFIDDLPKRPVVSAFTATATTQIKDDIVRLLRLQRPKIEVTGFDRPNLFFDVRHPKDKKSALIELIHQRSDKSGIVYCSTRANVESVYQLLCSYGVQATKYHAGLDEDERHCAQEDFQFDRKNVMVATNAFGMGIDKSNVSYVIHYNMPKSIEAYYQEAGRAGRDGAPADCVLLFSYGDVITSRYLIENNGNESLSQEELEIVRKGDFQRLNDMTGYCGTTKCLRGYILDYFGQSHVSDCGNCGNCCSSYELVDITIPAQMILSCVKRIRDLLGYYVGKMLVIKTLHGSRDKRVIQLGLDGLSTYGLMEKMSISQIRSYVDQLIDLGYLKVNTQIMTLELTSNSSLILFGGQKVSMSVRKEPAAILKRGKKPRDNMSKYTLGYDEELFSLLKALRSTIAQEENVPAYIVFSNATLTEMASKAPRSMSELMDISGVGKVKASRYGQRFLDAISDYFHENKV